LEQVFEIGQLEVYEHIENIPDVEITLEKVLDGHPLLYLLCTSAATVPTLNDRANQRCNVYLGIYPDTGESASGTPVSQADMTGYYISSVGYTFPVEGNFTESVTLVGNDKRWWNNYDGGPSGNPDLDAVVGTAFEQNADAPAVGSGVARREDMIFLSNSGLADNTVLPQDIDGITVDGVNSSLIAHIQNISVNVDLGRDNIFHLGARGPYHRYINFPVEVTTEIEVIAISGDMVSATEAGIISGLGCRTGENTRDRTIRIATCEGTRIYLGTRNRLSNVTYGGADAGGGNATTSYTYTGFNTFNVLHYADVNQNLSPATGSNKSLYLGAS
jgi:hypothetical protein